jgi:hypothetical protein
MLVSSETPGKSPLGIEAHDTLCGAAGRDRRGERRRTTKNCGYGRIRRMERMRKRIRDSGGWRDEGSEIRGIRGRRGDPESAAKKRTKIFFLFSRSVYVCLGAGARVWENGGRKSEESRERKAVSACLRAAFPVTYQPSHLPTQSPTNPVTYQPSHLSTQSPTLRVTDSCRHQLIPAHLVWASLIDAGN